MIGYSNLPPGCSINDLPGCRPQDEAYEQWAEEVDKCLDEETIDALDKSESLRNRVEEKFYNDFSMDDPVNPGEMADRIIEFVETWINEE